MIILCSIICGIALCYVYSCILSAFVHFFGLVSESVWHVEVNFFLQN